MNRYSLSILLILPIAGCGSSAVPIGDVCEKMLECDISGETTLAECEQEMQAMREVIRKPSWNALADCILEMTCQELSEDDGIMACLEAAAQAAPQGASDSFLEAYCQGMIDCGQFPGSVDDCVDFAKQQAGDYLGMLNMFTDSLIACMENCTADLSCDDLNNFFEVCGLQCELPFVEIDLDCDHGYQDEDVCVCDRGWAGELCDTCAEGYTWDGWDCVAECQPLSCSGHGLCDDSYGYLNCTCDTGYTGEFCEACAEGYLEVQGRCRPTAGCESDGPACDDGLSCTSGDVCSQGVCLGVDLDCDDGIACTLDSCLELAGGCLHEPQPTDEPEGYLGDPVCQDGQDNDCDGSTDAEDPDCWTLPCVSEADCPDDLNPCTQAVCDAGLCYWPPAPDATPCPGADECSSQYICRGTVCLPDYPDADGDQDGFVDGTCLHGFDCEVSDPDIHPGAEGPQGDPSCSDGLDNDCDGLTDAFDQSCWPMDCNIDGWCLEFPRTGSEPYNALWAVAPDDVWAASRYNWIIHWDGLGWSRVASPNYWGINDLCGCATDDLWAAGQTGVIFHWDGFDWQEFPTPNQPHTLNGIWCGCDGASTVEGWAVGRPGVILYFDGLEWTLDSFQAPTDFNDVWATGTGEAWAVGDGGYLARYQNATWQPVASGTNEYLNGIWGRSPTEVWAVGNDGVVLTYDGNGWTPQSLGSYSDLENVWGPAGGAGPWAVGSQFNDAAVLEYSAGAWQESDHFGSGLPALGALGGTAPDDTWAVGRYGTIIHSDGVVASRLTPGIGYQAGICASESPDGRVRAWVLGQSQEALLEWNGASWQVTHTGWEGGVQAYWCGGPHGIWMMNQNGEYLRFGASLLETGDVGELGITTSMYALSGREAENRIELWAVGRYGTTAYYDGTAWTQEHISDTWEDLRAVWFGPPSSSPEVFAAGSRGMLATRDASGWTLHPDITDEDLTAVWGDGQGGVWVVGRNNTVLKWNGSTFIPETVPIETTDLTDIQGTGPGDVWVAGQRGILRYDGQNWTAEAIEYGNDRYLAVTPSHVWVMEGPGAIYHKTR